MLVACVSISPILRPAKISFPRPPCVVRLRRLRAWLRYPFTCLDSTLDPDQPPILRFTAYSFSIPVKEIGAKISKSWGKTYASADLYSLVSMDLQSRSGRRSTTMTSKIITNMLPLSPPTRPPHVLRLLGSVSFPACHVRSPGGRDRYTRPIEKTMSIWSKLSGWTEHPGFVAMFFETASKDQDLAIH